jgi:hypothetical protein
LHPQPRVGKIKTTRVSHHGRAGFTRHSRTRMVLTVSFALSLVTGLFCHHHPQVHHLADLISASGYQDHTTLPSAEAPLVLRRRRVHRIPRPTSVTIAKRPSFKGARRREGLKMICPTGRTKYFRQKDWTVESALIGFKKFAVWRRVMRVIRKSKRSLRANVFLRTRRRSSPLPSPALRKGNDEEYMKAKPGEIMGYLAYAHPFLDGNGSTISRRPTC